MDKALETVNDMIKQRGYKIKDNDDSKIIGINDNGKQIVVFKQPIDKFNVDHIKQKVSILNNIGIKNCIVIYTNSVTSIAKKLVESSIDIEFELFTQDELQYNITKHRLVPEHIKLYEEEAKIFKKNYGMKFSIILKTDPVCRFYNFQRGDIIKIIRMTDNIPYITHRIVKG